VLPKVLAPPDFDRADAIQSYWGKPRTRAFGELLIDCEEDRTLRAVLVGMLRGSRAGADEVKRRSLSRTGTSMCSWLPGPLR
jgi:hypothetical protein